MLMRNLSEWLVAFIECHLFGTYLKIRWVLSNGERGYLGDFPDGQDIITEASTHPHRWGKSGWRCRACENSGSLPI